MTQQVSYRPIKCQSRSWPSRVTTVNGSHINGEGPLLKPTGIQFATKSMLGTTTNGEHQKLIGVKTMSLFGYGIRFLLLLLLLLLLIHTFSVLSLQLKKTTVTQQVSHRPIKCQSRLWAQRGTKVNGSHHGDNPLLRPTGIQIVTKSYAALQAMAPTNIKTVHQTSLLHIESNLDGLGMLSPTHDQRSQQ